MFPPDNRTYIFVARQSGNKTLGCSHEKTRTGSSLIPGWLFDFVSGLHYDRVISYLVIWRCTCDSKSQTLRMRYPFQCFTPKRLWSFRVYMIPLPDFVPEWNSRPGTRTGVNSRRGDLRRHNILWWYHLNKYGAIRGNRSVLAPGRKSSRCHVDTP